MVVCTLEVGAASAQVLHVVSGLGTVAQHGALTFVLQQVQR